MPKKPKAGPPKGFKTIDYGDGMHGLFLVGPGYAWESIGRHVAKQLKLAGLTFDCEGGMFAVRAPDPAALAKLQSKLEPFLADRDAFKKLVAKLGES